MTYDECLTYLKQYRIQIVKELDILESCKTDEDKKIPLLRLEKLRDQIKLGATHLNKIEFEPRALKAEKIRISINYDVNGKLKPTDQKGFENFTTKFKQENLSPEQILELIKTGWAYSPSWFRNRRTNANFVLSELVSIDIDDGLTIEQALSDKFIKNNALFIHTTSSHTEEKNRFRIMFHLPKLIDSVEEYKTWVISIMKHLKFADPSCKDVCRGFYGAKDCQTWLLGKTISEEVFLEISKELRAKEEVKNNKLKIDYPVNAERNYKVACSILDTIPNKIDYEDWFKILCVLKAEFGEATGQSLCSMKWSGDQFKDVPYKLRTINREELNFGTLVHIGQQYGWSIKNLN